MTGRSRVKAFAPDPDAPPQCCDHPDCVEPAGYKAPRGRDNLQSYFWFCLEHVRAYNAKWDFYRGMSPGQIEAHLRADTSWQRPSWKLGNMGQATKPGFSTEDLHDPLNILRQNAKKKQKEYQRKNTSHHRSAAQAAPASLRESLAVLNIDWPTTLQNLKAHYRSLARKYHPDTNPGNLSAEERFKSIGAAYNKVRSYFNHIKSSE